MKIYHRNTGVQAASIKQGRRSNGSAVRAETDGRYHMHYLPALLSNAVDNEQLDQPKNVQKGMLY